MVLSHACLGLNGREHAPSCIRCGYDLTALDSPRCPECGWQVDRAPATAPAKGTFVYRPRGLESIPAALKTVVLVLFRPVRFAGTVRHDEPLWPPTLVALASYRVAFLPSTILDWRRALSVNTGCHAAILSCMAVTVIGFVVLGAGRHATMNWRQRARLMLLVSLYTTCFVGVWPLTEPPALFSMQESYFLLPFDSRLLTFDTTRLSAMPVGGWQFVGRTLIFYWWAAILIVFTAVRAPARAGKLFFAVVPFLAAYAASNIGYRIRW